MIIISRIMIVIIFFIAVPNIYAEYYMTIKTPNGKKTVQVILRNHYDQSTYNQIDAHWKKLYPNAKLIDPSSNTYNCHSYAWNSQSRNNIYWIYDPTPYWEGGGYNNKQTRQIQWLDKIVYFNENNDPIHSSLWHEDSVKQKKLIVQSKWGNGPVFRHNLESCPYMDKTVLLNIYEVPPIWEWL